MDPRDKKNTKKTIRKVEELLELDLIDPEELSTLREVSEQFSISISPHSLQLIANNDSNQAIAKQFIPRLEELQIEPEELNDPIGDETYTVTKGLVHRYPDRVLLKPIAVCPVYCRFCFRREKVGPNQEAMSKNELAAAYEYIREHKEIWEVILSGGDPLVMKPKQLGNIISALNEIDHVSVIRIHTRVPAVKPESITDELIAQLKVKKPVYIILHVNHASEFTDEVRTACAQLVDAGLPLLSQSVLLRDVNDNIESLGKLMRTFIENRIKPYYLHHCDLAKGTSHFRVPLEKGQNLMRTLRQNFSGLCQPTFVLDIPGGFGKVPIGHNYVTSKKSAADKSEYYLIEDPQGNLHEYKIDIK